MMICFVRFMQADGASVLQISFSHACFDTQSVKVFLETWADACKPSMFLNKGVQGEKCSQLNCDSSSSIIGQALSDDDALVFAAAADAAADDDGQRLVFGRRLVLSSSLHELHCIHIPHS